MHGALFMSLTATLEGVESFWLFDYESVQWDGNVEQTARTHLYLFSWQGGIDA